MAERDVEIQGSREIIRWIRDGRRRRDWLKELLSDLGDYATAQQRVYAPDSDTGYIQRHIQQGDITYHPGGPGGGGSYRLITGVKRGVSLHPLYVHEGTKNLSEGDIDALIGPSGSGVSMGSTMQDRIYPKKPGGVLVLNQKGNQKGPRTIRKSVRGQRPKPFVYFAFAHTSVYAQGQIRASLGRLS